MGDAGAGAIRGKDDPPVALAPAPAAKIADIDVEAQTWLSAKSDASRTRSGIPGLRSFGGSDKRRMEQATAGEAVEYTVPTSKKFAHLGLWFVLNLVLTIFNKAVLGEFAYPWLLTALHATCVSAGCGVLLVRGHLRLTRLRRREALALAVFSTLFTANIAVSNVSLEAVSVPFHQIMRSTCPVFTIALHRLAYGRRYSRETYLTLAPVIAGVAIAVWGDVHASPAGFWLTLLGVVLASLKTVVSNRLMTGALALPPLEILLRMSPLAALQALFFASRASELARLRAAYPAATPTSTNSAIATRWPLAPLAALTSSLDGIPPAPLLTALLINGLLAFALNVSSLQANRRAGALALTVAGNLKQCATIVLGVALFGVKVGWANGVGMGVAVLGGAAFSAVELGARATGGNGPRVGGR